jgi:transcriptional regulator with XRE-family HTH domain
MEMTFAQHIRTLRKKKKWSVYDLAKEINRTPGYISKIEARGEIPSPDMILKLAEVLGTDAGKLVEVAKKEKSEEISEAVKEKYDNAFALYRRSRRR